MLIKGLSALAGHFRFCSLLARAAAGAPKRSVCRAGAPPDFRGSSFVTRFALHSTGISGIYEGFLWQHS
jgi:hypothetical protein